MKISLHGGACCGIKHIHEMGSDPTGEYGGGMLAARSALTGTETSFKRHGVNGVNDAHADTYPEDFFPLERPSESPVARLDAMLEWLKVVRPHHCVEIVLTLSQKRWFPLLEERGFKKVTEFSNCNTGNKLSVFHLTY